MKQFLALAGLIAMLQCTGGCTKISTRGGCFGAKGGSDCTAAACECSGRSNMCGSGCQDQCGGGARGCCQPGVCTGCRPAPLRWQQGGSDYAHKLNYGMLKHGKVQQNPGPPGPTVGYPYYTVRGPRDFLASNPPSIGR